MGKEEEVTRRMKKRLDPESGETELWIESNSSEAVTFTEPCPCCGNKKRPCFQTRSGPRKRLLVVNSASLRPPTTTALPPILLKRVTHITAPVCHPICEVDREIEIGKQLMEIKRQIEDVMMDSYGYLLERVADKPERY